MVSHIVAKEKIEKLTTRLKKSIYNLNYGDMELTVMDDVFYDRVKCICDSHDFPFPLIIRNGEILIECDTPNAYTTLASLAEDYQIVIDTKKTTT